MGLLWTSPPTTVPAVLSSVFSCSFPMLLSARSATSITSAPFLLLYIVSGWLASICLSVWNLKSQRILTLMFSTCFCGVAQWERGNSHPHLAQMFLYTIPTTWLSAHTVPACILRPATLCWSFSGASSGALQMWVLFAVVDPFFSGSAA